jgi:hypothetical protein
VRELVPVLLRQRDECRVAFHGFPRPGGGGGHVQVNGAWKAYHNRGRRPAPAVWTSSFPAPKGLLLRSCFRLAGLAGAKLAQLLERVDAGRVPVAPVEADRVAADRVDRERPDILTYRFLEEPLVA